MRILMRSIRGVAKIGPMGREWRNSLEVRAGGRSRS
jgi:hypothetical protein